MFKWFYGINEGNDLKNLKYEITNSILIKYLKDLNLLKILKLNKMKLTIYSQFY